MNENSGNKKEPWPTLIEEGINEYNSTVHSVTQFSPT